MRSTGYIQIYAYTSRARLPVRDVAVMVTDANNRVLAMGLTDKNGKYGPVAVSVPERQESLTPNAPERPYSTVNLHAQAANFEQIEADNVQVFANTVTTQNFELIPLAELPDQWTKTEFFTTPGQNL